jgi:hypothetical protein
MLTGILLQSVPMVSRPPWQATNRWFWRPWLCRDGRPSAGEKRDNEPGSDTGDEAITMRKSWTIAVPTHGDRDTEAEA